jgi:hypothetical protein
MIKDANQIFILTEKLNFYKLKNIIFIQIRGHIAAATFYGIS